MFVDTQFNLQEITGIFDNSSKHASYNSIIRSVITTKNTTTNCSAEITILTMMILSTSNWLQKAQNRQLGKTYEEGHKWTMESR